MRLRMPLLVGAVLLVGLGLAGAATAVPADDNSISEQTIGDDTDTNNETTDDGDVGICVTGVDSECNGEEYDGDNDTATDDGQRIGSDDDDGDDAGICMIGVDSECNGDENDGTPATGEEVTGSGSGSGDALPSTDPFGFLSTLLSVLF